MDTSWDRPPGHIALMPWPLAGAMSMPSTGPAGDSPLGRPFRRGRPTGPHCLEILKKPIDERGIEMKEGGFVPTNSEAFHALMLWGPLCVLWLDPELPELSLWIGTISTLTCIADSADISRFQEVS